MPQEFTSVSASSYDAAGLATKLTDKSAEGWAVVGIVTSGTELVAFLQRESTGASPAAAASPTTSSGYADTSSSSTPTYAAAATTTAAAASEPSGWGTAPASSTTASTPAASADPSGGYSAASQPAAAAATAAAAPAATSSVPAGWYADPAGRFDLRYWDGSTWTEHVSRAGQQFTDPPVA